MIITVSVNIMIVNEISAQIIKKRLTPYCSRVSYSIPYIGVFITYFFLGIGSCFGGLSLKYSNSKFITSETGLACSSPSLSRKSRILGVVRNAINSDRFSFIRRLQCITIYIDN